ncbi:MAG: YgiQ family radical SAM protein [Lachnospiraceae bacterium]|nr:YgiQ family radical SAM protein [Lachnospiraceae bacterium]
MNFLPTTPLEMEERNIKQLDFVYVCGDAYVDHPSFGHAIISRVLTAHGYSVGILSQPDWRRKESVMALGRPRLGFLVSAGNMDSMVNHYTVSKKRRSTDAYTPGGVIGKRPDYAVVVYCNLIRWAYRDVPIIAGGIEASLRRLAHYDYWSDSLKRSVLMDSGADLISYGMGERSIVEIADALDSGLSIRDITFIDGTCYKTRHLEDVYDYVLLPSYEEMKADKSKYAQSFYTQYLNTDPFTSKRLAEPCGAVYVVQNPPSKPLTTQEMDDIYDLPYCRAAHPSYEALGGVPALHEVKFSLISNRGCFGGCSFCALTFHQGRIVQVRSHDSIVKEARQMTEEPDFKGYIHDVGGPTANFRHPACKKQMEHGVCKNRQCLFPEPCKHLDADHSDYVALLRRLRALPKVKKVFIRSGIRFDYLLADSSDTFFRELVTYHISGQLKVAPEHVSDRVLEMMGKPKHCVYQRFTEAFQKMNQACGMEQYLVPYLMSSHPGCSMKEAVELSCYLRDLHFSPEQVQDFYPTPSTISTCMYYTGLDPRTMKPVYVEKNPHRKKLQRALIQYRNPENYELVREALELAGRTDLIGYGQECLIRPRRGASSAPDLKTGKAWKGKQPAGSKSIHGKPRVGTKHDMERSPTGAKATEKQPRARTKRGIEQSRAGAKAVEKQPRAGTKRSMERSRAGKNPPKGQPRARGNSHRAAN